VPAEGRPAYAPFLPVADPAVPTPAPCVCSWLRCCMGAPAWWPRACFKKQVPHGASPAGVPEPRGGVPGREGVRAAAPRGAPVAVAFTFKYPPPARLTLHLRPAPLPLWGGAEPRKGVLLPEQAASSRAHCVPAARAAPADVRTRGTWMTCSPGLRRNCIRMSASSGWAASTHPQSHPALPPWHTKRPGCAKDAGHTLAACCAHRS